MCSSWRYTTGVGRNILKLLSRCRQYFKTWQGLYQGKTCKQTKHTSTIDLLFEVLVDPGACDVCELVLPSEVVGAWVEVSVWVGAREVEVTTVVGTEVVGATVVVVGVTDVEGTLVVGATVVVLPAWVTVLPTDVVATVVVLLACLFANSTKLCATAASCLWTTSIAVLSS